MKFLLILFLSIGSFTYFSYHFFFALKGQGFAKSLSQLCIQKEAELEKARLEEQKLAVKVKGLNPTSFDPDIADERIRLILNKARPAEEVIVVKDSEETEPYVCTSS